MNNRYVLIVLLVLAGCSTTQGVLEGGSAGSQGIVVGKITVLGRSPASMISFEARPLVGPRGSFTTDNQDTLVVETLVPATYSWTEGRMVALPQRLNLSGSLRPFVANKGCISYFGDITFDLTGVEPRVSMADHKDETMAQAKVAHPQMFAANPPCQ